MASRKHITPQPAAGTCAGGWSGRALGCWASGQLPPHCKHRWTRHESRRMVLTMKGKQAAGIEKLCSRELQQTKVCGDSGSWESGVLRGIISPSTFPLVDGTERRTNTHAKRDDDLTFFRPHILERDLQSKSKIALTFRAAQRTSRRM